MSVRRFRACAITARSSRPPQAGFARLRSPRRFAPRRRLSADVIPSMYIAEIIRPGTWLDLADRDVAFELEGMLSNLEDRVAEAAIALTMFAAAAHARGDPRAEWERDAQIRAEIDDQLRKEVGALYYRDFDTFRLESERRALKRKAELD